MEINMPEVVFTWQFWVAGVLCYVVCEAVKRIPKMSDWGINLINLVVGAIIYTALIGGWADPANYLFGVLAASVADIAYQLYKNIFNSVSTVKEITIDDVNPGGTD